MKVSSKTVSKGKKIPHVKKTTRSALKKTSQTVNKTVNKSKSKYDKKIETLLKQIMKLKKPSGKLVPLVTIQLAKKCKKKPSSSKMARKIFKA